MTQNRARRTRASNKWTIVTFLDITKHLTESGTSVSDFVKRLGVTGTTFHNWKNARCAPTEEVQFRIRDVINGIAPGEKIAMAKKKTTKKTAAAAPEAAKTRGKGSTSLAALAEATPTTTTETKPAIVKVGKATKKKAAKKAAKKPAKKKAGRKPGPRRKTAAIASKVKAPRKPKAAPSNGTSSASAWAELSTLGTFLKANPGKSREELVGVLDVARELLV